MILLNGTKVNFGKFPNGETKMDEAQIHSLMSASDEKDTISLKYEDDSDLIKLMFIKKYLNDYKTKVSLDILYMPYSRMDRSENRSAFTLKYISNFINTLDFSSVTVVEPHSDVTLALIDRSTAFYPTIDLLDATTSQIGFDKEKDYLFFPDAGAQKRYSKLKGFKSIVGYKSRDFATGKINGLQVIGEVDQPRKVLILDDLCSYGGTFIMSAEKLREIGFEEVYLFVAHSEPSIYEGKIFKTDLIDKVFATNSMIEKSQNEKLNIFEI